MLVLCFVTPGFAAPPNSFDAAKPVATKLWWDIGPISFYCGCPYRKATRQEKGIRKGDLWVIGSACGYRARTTKTKKGKINARALRIEFEHIVPADSLKTGFNCRTRKKCREIPGYKQAEGDLFNLVPAVGELNADRSDKLHGVIPEEKREYGACDFEVSRKLEVAEPMETIRGDIARVWLYMIERYGLKLPPDYVTTLNEWSVSDPVDQAERRRHAIIANEMGRKNPKVVPH